MASPGIQDVAELGQTNAFRSEINASDNVGAIIERSLGTGGTPEVSVEFETTKDHPLVTLITMIAPSPDWFVGVSGLSLLDARDRWLRRLEVGLSPYKAPGSRAGDSTGAQMAPSEPANALVGRVVSVEGLRHIHSRICSDKSEPQPCYHGQ